MEIQANSLLEEFVDNAYDAIANLKLMSSELERLSTQPRHYNTEYAAYLEQLAHEMYRNANELKCLVSYYGEV